MKLPQELTSLPLSSRPSPMLACAARLALALFLLVGFVSHPAAQTSCGFLGAPGGSVPGVDGAVKALVMWDPDGPGPATERLVVGGNFLSAGGQPASRVAAYDPATATWSPIGAGLGTEVQCLLAMPNGDLIAGVWPGISAVMRWNGTAWSALGSPPYTLTGRPYALARRPSGRIVVGGDFSNKIAEWNGVFWDAQMSQGFYGEMRSLKTLANGDLLAGGGFPPVWNAPNSNYIARWNGVTWQGLGTGMNAQVNAVDQLPNGDIVAGGAFTQAGGVTVNRVARWDGTSWSALGPPGNVGVDNLVMALGVMANGDLLVGGSFSNAGGYWSERLAVWSGGNWMPNWADGSVFAFVTSGAGDSYVGGGFELASGGRHSHVAKYGIDHGCRSLGTGFDRSPSALKVAPNGDLIAGGSFERVGSVSAHCVARWSGSAWAPIGAGVEGYVNAVTVLPAGDVVVAGGIPAVGGAPCSGVARWNGVSWSSMGPGAAAPSDVWALTVSGGDVISAGSFAAIGGVPATNVAKWNGSSWQALGAGVYQGTWGPSGYATCAAAAANGDVFIGGDFMVAGGQFSRGVARWDGANWQSLAGGVSGVVQCIAMLPDGSCVVGGDFQWAGVVPVSNIARWDGAAWSALGLGLNWPVTTLAVLPGGSLIAGGQFTASGTTSTPHVAVWNGGAWSAAGGGADFTPTVVACLPTGQVACAGDFAHLGGVAVASLGWLLPQCPGTVTSYGTPCALSAGPMTMSATQLPWVGGSFQARCVGATSLGFGLSLVGLANAAQPLSALHPAGVPGCQLLAAPDAVLLLLANQGAYSFGFAVPPNPGLAGISLFSQILQVELGAGGGLSSLAGSNGMQLLVGGFQ